MGMGGPGRIIITLIVGYILSLLYITVHEMAHVVTAYLSGNTVLGYSVNILALSGNTHIMIQSAYSAPMMLIAGGLIGSLFCFTLAFMSGQTSFILSAWCSIIYGIAEMVMLSNILLLSALSTLTLGFIFSGAILEGGSV